YSCWPLARFDREATASVGLSIPLPACGAGVAGKRLLVEGKRFPRIFADRTNSALAKVKEPGFFREFLLDSEHRGRQQSQVGPSLRVTNRFVSDHLNSGGSRFVCEQKACCIVCWMSPAISVRVEGRAGEINHQLSRDFSCKSSKVDRIVWPGRLRRLIKEQKSIEYFLCDRCFGCFCPIEHAWCEP